MEETHQTRADPWILFCGHHTDPGNVALHLLAWVAFWGGLLLGLVHLDPAWLLLSLAAGPLCHLGHFLFEKEDSGPGRPMLLELIPFHVGRMVLRTLTGRYVEDIAEARAHRQTVALLSFWKPNTELH